MNGVILGGGITGLSAGIATGFPVYEEKDKPGGLCRSYKKAGYLFERGGGHWIFGKGNGERFLNQYAQFHRYDRRAEIYINQYFDYPIQNYFAGKTKANYDSMKQWLLDQFGEDQCRIFFHPFNNKYTAGLYDVIVQDDPQKSPAYGAGYNPSFLYPTDSLSQMVDNMAKSVTLNLKKKAMHIYPVDKVVEFNDGSRVGYDKLITTLPLTETMRMCGFKDFTPPFTSVVVLNIGAERGDQCPNGHWYYIPDPKHKFFRVGIYSNVNPSQFAPEGGVALYVERALLGHGVEDDYESTVIKTLQNWGWIKMVHTVDQNHIHHAYTWNINPKTRQDAVAKLAELDIISTGRYGKWQFQGILKSVEDGLALKGVK